MSASSQFDDLKQLARDKRKQHEVDTSTLGLKKVREIYKTEGIKIDYHPLPNKVKALYMCDDNHHSVAVQKKLPDEPKIFALIHELKHHYCDQELLRSGYIHCGDFNMSDPIEVGAEKFAAEFIYPIREFAHDISLLNITKWSDIDIINFKRSCKAKVSYAYICRRLTELESIGFNQFKGVQFQKREYEIFGLPYHLRRKRFKSG